MNPVRYPVARAFTLYAEGYGSETIATVRKYNVWRNGGWMKSDATNPALPWQDGEENDPYPLLTEGSGQAYPEVDHIVPKKQPKLGLNSYRNARLVSFAHNHIYREKPSVPTIQEKIEEFCLRPISDMQKERIRAEWPYLYSDRNIYANICPSDDENFSPGSTWVNDRRKALYKVQQLKRNCENETRQEVGFREVRLRAAQGVQLFDAAFALDNSCATPIKNLIVGFNTALATKSANYSLSVLSDVPVALIRDSD